MAIHVISLGYMGNLEALFTMRAVVRRTGLKPDLLRAWERRYGAIRPARSSGGQRLYTEQDVKRLILLHAAIAAGHRIGDIAGLPTEELVRLGGSELAGDRTQRGEMASEASDASLHMQGCLAAIGRLDGEGLVLCLEQATFSLPRSALIDRLILPLMVEVGRLWETGQFHIAHEHIASSAVRSLLGRLLMATPRSETAPLMLSTTPARQLHEFGALAAAVAAAADGWNVIYPGPNLPADEILFAVVQNVPQVVALSIIHPPDDPRLAQELELLGQHLPSETKLLVGGRASTAYRRVIEAAGGKWLEGIQDLRAELRALREADKPQ